MDEWDAATRAGVSLTLEKVQKIEKLLGGWWLCGGSGGKNKRNWCRSRNGMAVFICEEIPPQGRLPNLPISFLKHFAQTLVRAQGVASWRGNTTLAGRVENREV
jgi:hypothetical protein